MTVAMGGFAVVGCGGEGGGGAVTPAPTPSPSPVPTPSPAPTPGTSVNDTAEYRASEGAVSMKALTAYDRGFTGAGVKMAVVDTGIDLESTEFTGRLDPASADLAGNGTLDDINGHGTAVATLAAAKRDGVGGHGVAFDATIVAFRVDLPGTCAGAGGCIYGLDAVALAIDRAREAGARVINLSMIADIPPRATMLAAVDRATAAGIVITICAGNEGASEPQTLAAALAADPVAREQVLIVGAVGGGDVTGASSNRAGDSAAHFITTTAGSCSAATPLASGALALLAQANPTKTGAQLLALLYASARDVGATGQDRVYGRGVVDLTRAFP
ncbi:MAG: S8 family serine peptidase [Sphingomonas sp.]